MRLWITLALLAAITSGVAASAQAYTCTTHCWGNSCTTTCF